MCIGCGACIKACSHDARRFHDDISEFLYALSKNRKMVAIVAPAIAANFPGQYLKINTLLKEIGVDAVFDVSFGAELTVKSYLDYIVRKNPDTVISQPCPAIVTYVQIYHPELLPFLAPADSPMMHTMKMIRKYYPCYSNHKIVVISPCIAKRREFDEVGIGDYNVTIKSLKELMDENNINLSQYPDTDYDNPPAERAVLFSSPGGLIRTAEREVPSIGNVSRKIEGRDAIYPYLNDLHKQIKGGYAPVLVDCLNCISGCNGGPGTLNEDKHPDEMEYHIEKRNLETQGLFKSPDEVDESLNSFWKEDIYSRKYRNLSGNNHISIPGSTELSKIYIEMQKIKKEDFYNCAFCGYDTCERMAIAIYNGLNRKENCYHYKSNIITSLATNVKETSDNLQLQNEKIKQLILKTYDVTEFLKNEFDNLLATVNSNSGRLSEFDRIVNSISQIANKSNILALNASIEAAHAGNFGRGFSVVATEMKHLSESSGKESDKIKPYLKEIAALFLDMQIKINDASDKFKSSTQLNREMNESLGLVTDMVIELNEKAGLFVDETHTIFSE